MNEQRKICVITGTRAEYGLLYWLLREIESADDLELQLVVTGTHLSPEFGNTYRQIEEDGFTISHKVEMLLSSDSPVGITKSMGLAMSGFADAYSELEPDLAVVLGDRYEIFSAAAAATVARIPLAHLHGGETTEGAFDESFRHSITKMAHLHFVAAEEYRKRVIQLGEDPERVFNVGALGVENISRLDLMTKEEIEDSLEFKFDKFNLLITFHPVTLEYSTAETQFNNLLCALDELSDTKLIFTKANADTDGRVINSLIDQYVQKNTNKAASYTSLGQLRYLSVMRYVDAVVGNSSSGLIEAPSFKIGTINIGDRQKGRIRSDSVIDCDVSVDEIRAALATLYKDEFRRQLNCVVNVYNGNDVAQAIVQIIRKYDFSSLLKKSFFDL